MLYLRPLCREAVGAGAGAGLAGGRRSRPGARRGGGDDHDPRSDQHPRRRYGPGGAGRLGPPYRQGKGRRGHGDKGSRAAPPGLSDDPCGRPGERQCTAACRSPLGPRRRAQSDAGGQGGVLRYRRAPDQARPGHAADEKGHGRRGACHRARPDDHDRRPRYQAAGADSGGGEQRVGQCSAAARYRQDAERDHRRNQQYRCGGPARPVRCPHRGGERGARSADRLRHPHRRGEDRPGGGASGLLLQ